MNELWSTEVFLPINILCDLLQVCVVLSAVLGSIIYRITIVTVIYEGGNVFVKRHAKIFTSMTAALINLIIIMILTKVSSQKAFSTVHLDILLIERRKLSATDFITHSEV